MLIKRRMDEFGERREATRAAINPATRGLTEQTIARGLSEVHGRICDVQCHVGQCHVGQCHVTGSSLVSRVTWGITIHCIQM